MKNEYQLAALPLARLERRIMAVAALYHRTRSNNTARRCAARISVIRRAAALSVCVQLGA